MKNIFLACIFVLSLTACQQQQATQLSHYVNPLIGTAGPGNTYPGATVPFGMVQLSPDNGLPGWDRIAGYYYPDSTIAGFSHTHLSGTGAGDMYDLLLFPTNSRFTRDLWPGQKAYRPYSLFSHQHERASPGYYKVLLESSGIKAELTATEHVGMHRYTFPPDSSSKIILDLGYALNWDKPTETSIRVENNHTISGVRKSTGWAKVQHVYFVAEFSKPFEHYRLFENFQPSKNTEVKHPYTKFETSFSNSQNEIVLVKIALSTVSVENARKNLNTEIKHWNFDRVRETARQKWEQRLRTILIDTDEPQKEIFYTNLYHIFLTPNLLCDTNGQYKGADQQIHSAQGFKRYDTFSLWDTYRATHPLYTLLCPSDVHDMIASMLAHYDETGLLPVWSMAGNETNMMIGYHAVPAIVDAFFKGISMDTAKAYAACKASAMNDTEEMKQYRQLGFVPYTTQHENWSVSKTLEYTYDDWCIAQFAAALGRTTDHNYFLQRAQNWKKLYDRLTNFFRAKPPNGAFVKPFTPKDYTNAYCESNAWQYLFAPHHAVEQLRDTMGSARFEELLDSLFSYHPSPEDKLPIFSTGMIGQYAHGNEPSHHVTYLYNLTGNPWKGQKRIREILSTLYSTRPDGYCGNEDCGQMSAWYVFSSLGFYPVNPATGKYWLGSPAVRSAQIHLENGNTFTIIAHNNDARHPYVQQVLLNGKILNRHYITHSEIMKGGTLQFEMSDTHP